MGTVIAVSILVLFAAMWAVALYYGSKLPEVNETADDIAQDAPIEPRRLVAITEAPADVKPERVFTVVLKEGTRLRPYTGKGRRPYRLVVDGYSFEPKGTTNGVPLYVRCDRTLRQVAQGKRP
jgi:hypothetical protein